MSLWIVESVTLASDPDGLTAAWERPDGAIILQTYGTDAALGRTGPGSYQTSIPLLPSGTYTLRWLPKGGSPVDVSFPAQGTTVEIPVIPTTLATTGALPANGADLPGRMRPGAT